MGCVGVCGSINMDVFGYVERLPAPGETLRGSRLAYAPGGKGANQAVAAARLGARVRFTGACGRDEFGDELAAALRDDGVDLAGLRRVDVATGVALILVDDAGENQIVAIPGANDTVGPPAPDAEVDVWLVQAEIPLEGGRGHACRSPCDRCDRGGQPVTGGPDPLRAGLQVRHRDRERDRARRPRRGASAARRRDARRAWRPHPPGAHGALGAPSPRPRHDWCRRRARGCGCGGALGGTIARGRARVGDRHGLARGRAARLPAGDAEASRGRGPDAGWGAG